MNNPFTSFNDILKQYVSDKAITFYLPNLWKDKKRFYHNTGHLIQIIQDIEKNMYFKELPLYEKHTLLLAAFFHDAIYDPKKQDNEDASIRFLKSVYISKDAKMLHVVCDLIETTKHRKRPIKKLQRIFWDADNSKFKGSYEDFFKVEKQLQREYSFMSKEEYKEKRLKFLEQNIGLFGTIGDKNIKKLIEYIKKL
jgi:predicted metal-dependent HD superfamily phosphohydrolase